MNLLNYCVDTHICIKMAAREFVSGYVKQRT